MENLHNVIRSALIKYVYKPHKLVYYDARFGTVINPHINYRSCECFEFEEVKSVDEIILVDNAFFVSITNMLDQHIQLEIWYLQYMQTFMYPHKETTKYDLTVIIPAILNNPSFTLYFQINKHPITKHGYVCDYETYTWDTTNTKANVEYDNAAFMDVDYDEKTYIPPVNLNKEGNKEIKQNEIKQDEVNQPKRKANTDQFRALLTSFYMKHKDNPLDILNTLIDIKTDDWDLAITLACHMNNFRLFQVLIEYCKAGERELNWDDVLIAVCNTLNVEWIKYALEMSEPITHLIKWDSHIARQIHCNTVDVALLLLNHVETLKIKCNWGPLLQSAIENHQTPIIDKILTIYNEILNLEEKQQAATEDEIMESLEAIKHLTNDEDKMELIKSYYNEVQDPQMIVSQFLQTAFSEWELALKVACAYDYKGVFAALLEDIEFRKRKIEYDSLFNQICKTARNSFFIDSMLMHLAVVPNNGVNWTAEITYHLRKKNDGLTNTLLRYVDDQDIECEWNELLTVAILVQAPEYITRKLRMFVDAQDIYNNVEYQTQTQTQTQQNNKIVYQQQNNDNLSNYTYEPNGLSYRRRYFNPTYETNGVKRPIRQLKQAIKPDTSQQTEKKGRVQFVDEDEDLDIYDIEEPSPREVMLTRNEANRDIYAPPDYLMQYQQRFALPPQYRPMIPHYILKSLNQVLRQISTNITPIELNKTELAINKCIMIEEKSEGPPFDLRKKQNIYSAPA